MNFLATLHVRNLIENYVQKIEEFAENNNINGKKILLASQSFFKFENRSKIAGVIYSMRRSTKLRELMVDLR